MKNFLDRVFLPVEQADWRVEQIRMHPKEFAELQKNAKPDTLDMIAVAELVKAGYRAHIFGAQVNVSVDYRPDHYEVLFGDLQRKNVVCLRKNEMVGEDCPELDCLVDAVHAH